jgi:hypothetical protein
VYFRIRIGDDPAGPGQKETPMHGRSRCVLGLLCALIALSWSSTRAQPIDEGTLEFSGIAGAAIPFGDLGDVATAGFAVGGSFGYFISPASSIGATIVFNSFGVDDALEEPGVDSDYSITEFAATWKTLFGRSSGAQPYGRGFIGVYRSTVSASSDVFGFDFDVSASSSDLGIGAGIGLQVRGEESTVGGFAEGLLFSVFTEGSSSTYFGLRGGISVFVFPGP